MTLSQRSTARTPSLNRMGWVLPESQRVSSPNFSRGRGGFSPDILVIHYAVDGDVFAEADGDPEEVDPLFAPRSEDDDALDVAKLFARKARRASAHFAIGRDRSAFQCVSLDDTAWAQGGGAFPRNGVGPLEKPRAYEANRRGVSIELCNAGWAADRLGVPDDQQQEAAHRFTPRRKNRWETFPLKQISALEYIAALVRPSMGRNPGSPEGPVFVCGHEDMVNTHTQQLRYDRPGKFYGSKVDPGPLFPWPVIDWRALGYTPVFYDMKTRAWRERVR